MEEIISTEILGEDIQHSTIIFLGFFVIGLMLWKTLNLLEGEVVLLLKLLSLGVLGDFGKTRVRPQHRHC